MKKVLRVHYRANLKDNCDSEFFEKALEECKQRISLEITNGKILTCAIFHYKSMAFLYIEIITDKEVSGDVDSYCIYHKAIENIFAPLQNFLKVWPGIEEDRFWVPMFHIYCFAYPESLEEWRRPIPPHKRCGRIAILNPDKLHSYIYHHYAIVKEGCFKGDKYQSIAIHENIAFQYFETPRDRYITSVKGNSSQESIELKKWTNVDPESHFIHLPGSNGQNFLEIPCYFSISDS